MDTVKINPPMPEANKCPQCGTPLPTGALAGLCPACLLKMGAAADTVTDGRQPPFNPPSVAELAPLFPQLEILELIGKGGMGAVYKARQKQLDRIVALKILPPGIGHDAAFAERFAREARAMAMLSHPHIVAVYDFGEVGAGEDGTRRSVDQPCEGLSCRSGAAGQRRTLASVMMQGLFNPTAWIRTSWALACGKGISRQESDTAYEESGFGLRWPQGSSPWITGPGRLNGTIRASENRGHPGRLCPKLRTERARERSTPG